MDRNFDSLVLLLMLKYNFRSLFNDQNKHIHLIGNYVGSNYNLRSFVFLRSLSHINN